MTRTEYITVDELNEILSGSYSDDSATTLKINEASELLEYHMFDRLNVYSVLTAPTDLKLATAYQVQYMETGIDNDYASSSDSISLGKYSISKSGTKDDEYKKICPKAQRYLINGGLLRRIV